MFIMMIFWFAGKVLYYVFLYWLITGIFGIGRQNQRYRKNEEYNQHYQNNYQQYQQADEGQRLSKAYQTLGLREGASADDVKKAYRQLAKENHPDKNKSANAQQKMAEINAAYDTILETMKKKN